MRRAGQLLPETISTSVDIALWRSRRLLPQTIAGDKSPAPFRLLPVCKSILLRTTFSSVVATLDSATLGPPFPLGNRSSSGHADRITPGSGVSRLIQTAPFSKCCSGWFTSYNYRPMGHDAPSPHRNRYESAP